MTARPLRALRPKDAPAAPPDRGRILYTKDIQEMLGRKPDRKYRRSKWWVWTRFAPEYKRKLGREPFWFEYEAIRWLAEQGLKTQRDDTQANRKRPR